MLGLARTSLEGNVLTVELAAAGLTPEGRHLLHIHGFLDGSKSKLATYADDADGDGVVEPLLGRIPAAPTDAAFA